MRWIGQHVWSLISRFRHNVYIEKGADLYITSLANKNDYLKVEVGGDGETTLTTVDDDGADAALNITPDGPLVVSADTSITMSTSGTAVATYSREGGTIKRKFAITGNTDGSYDGDIAYFGGEAETIAAGQIVHYNASGNWELAESDDDSKSTGLLGVALGSDASVHGVLLRGMVTLSADCGSVGGIVYLSLTAGQGIGTAPSSSGNVVRVIGYCLHASNGQIWFNPDNTWVEIA